MPTVFFSSRDDGDLIEVELVKVGGAVRRVSLMVDSGFTGQSSFVLSSGIADVVHAPAPAGNVLGAIRGVHSRGLVVCQIPSMEFRRTQIAIITDEKSLSLLPGAEGLVGFRFLRHFKKWGGERLAPGVWNFFLTS